MSGLQILQLVAIALMVVSVAESFRARPWWPHSPGRPIERGPARGSSPRERRWLHGGLALVLLGSLVAPELEGDTVLSWLLLGVMGVAVAMVLVGFLRGPSPEDRRRWEEEVAGAASTED